MDIANLGPSMREYLVVSWKLRAFRYSLNQRAAPTVWIYLGAVYMRAGITSQMHLETLIYEFIEFLVEYNLVILVEQCKARKKKKRRFEL